MRLNGKRILLLGGTSGIGRAIAEAAAREGARLVIVSSRKSRVDETVATLPAGTEGHVVDLSNEDQVRGFFERVDTFDHLVFTAGETLRLGALQDMRLEDARKAFDLRFWGAYMAVKYGRAGVRPGGSVVLTTGIAEARPRKGWSVGASLCGAMDALTRALAVELAPIRVNAVSPGVVKTALWDTMSAADREAMYRQTGAALLVGRVGEPHDVAEVYVSLMCQGFTTGQTFVVDGGAVLV